MDQRTFVSVVSTSMVTSNELRLGEVAITKLRGKRRSQHFKRTHSGFGGVVGEGCTTSAHSRSSEMGSSISSMDNTE